MVRLLNKTFCLEKQFLCFLVCPPNVGHSKDLEQFDKVHLAHLIRNIPGQANYKYL